MSAGRKTAVGGRIALESRTVVLAAGDVAAIAVFVLLGELSHFSAAFVAANPGYVAGTALPFLLGWAVVAPPAGAYRGRRTGPLRAGLVGAAPP